MNGRPMVYADATTSAVVDVVDRYRDRTAPVRVGSRYRFGDTVATVVRVTLAGGGRTVAVTGRTDDGRTVADVIDAAALAPPLTLADSVDRIRAARVVR